MFHANPLAASLKSLSDSNRPRNHGFGVENNLAEPKNRFPLIELSLVVSTQRYAIIVHYDTALVMEDVMYRTIEKHC